MSSRNWLLRFEDIRDALTLIFDYVSEMDEQSWCCDSRTIDAVIRNLEIIGEAASHVPVEIQQQYPDIPWYEMRGMRNILVHEYFGVDNNILWRTVQDDLPGLLKKVTAVLEEQV